MHARRAHRHAAALAAGLVIASLVAPARATRAADDAFDLVKEEQVVTAAAKHTQRLSESPAAVSVITAAEIRAMGYRSLGEALQWARDLYVSYDRNYTYLGVRGLLRPGDYNDRVLLTIDGHAVNGAVFEDAAFGPELGLDLDAVQRIEVVRGPGSALYGTNALLAVVNVVTRRPQDEPGFAATAGVGAAGDRRLSLAAAHVTKGSLAGSLHATVSRTDGTDLYFPVFDAPATNFGRAHDADGERAVGLFGTLEGWGFTLHGKWNDRLKRIPTAAFDTRFNDRDTRTYDGHDFVELSTRRALTPSAGLDTRVYWDGVRYHGDYLFGPDSARVVNLDRGDADLVGAESRFDWSPHPRHRVTAGIEGAQVVHLALTNADVSPPVTYVDFRRSFQGGRAAAYAQVESRVSETLRLLVGGRRDVTQEAGAAWSPRASLVWRVTPETSIKALAGGAFRSPSQFELHYATAGLGNYVVNPNLDPERMTSFELGADRRWSHVRAQASLYRNHVHDLIDLVPLDSVALEYQNRSGVRVLGASAEVEFTSPGGRRVRLSGSVEHARDDVTGLRLSNAPACLVQALAFGPLWNRRATFGLGVRYGAGRRTLAGAWTKPAAVCDGRIAVHAKGALDFGLECRNAFDVRWSVPGSPEHAMDTITQDGRRIGVTVGVGDWNQP